MRIGLWATAFAAAGMLASTAQAGDAACLWNGLSLSARDTFLMDYDARGAEALNENTFSENELTASLTGCGVTDASLAVTAGEALGSYAAEQAAARVLKKTKGLAAGDLEAAWAGLDAGQRVSFRNWAVQSFVDGDAEPDVDTMLALLAALDVMQSEPAAEEVVTYYFARALREDRERKF